MTYFLRSKTFDLKLSYNVPKFGSTRQNYMGTKMGMLNDIGVIKMHKLNY